MPPTDSVVADRSFERPRQRARRRARLAVLIGQKLAVPRSADPNRAFELALEIAADPAFQRARRALNDWQEAVVAQEQSSRNDAQALADLVSDFNREVAKTAKATSGRWLFVVLKGAKEMVEIVEKPVSSFMGVALETAEARYEAGEEMKPGPTAVFHHTQGRVFGPAIRPSTVSARLRQWWGRRVG